MSQEHSIPPPSPEEIKKMGRRIDRDVFYRPEPGIEPHEIPTGGGIKIEVRFFLGHDELIVHLPDGKTVPLHEHRISETMSQLSSEEIGYVKKWVQDLIDNLKRQEQESGSGQKISGISNLEGLLAEIESCEK